MVLTLPWGVTVCTVCIVYMYSCGGCSYSVPFGNTPFEAIVTFPLVKSVNVGFLRSFGVVFDVSCVLPADANSVLRYFALKAATFALYT